MKEDDYEKKDLEKLTSSLFILRVVLVLSILLLCSNICIGYVSLKLHRIEGRDMISATAISILCQRVITIPSFVISAYFTRKSIHNVN